MRTDEAMKAARELATVYAQLTNLGATTGDEAYLDQASGVLLAARVLRLPSGIFKEVAENILYTENIGRREEVTHVDG